MNPLVIGAVVDHSYDFALVALSFVISVLGSYGALSLAASGRLQDKVVGPAVALGGCAIWSMHFIGMATATLACIAEAKRGDYGLDGPYLAYVVFFIALIALGASMVNNRFETAVVPG